MQLNHTQMAAMVTLLATTGAFNEATLRPTNNRSKPLWNAIDQTALALRLPLYNRRLGKQPAKPAVREEAIQKGLALLGAFGTVFDVKQVVVSTKDGQVDRVSFQPRPNGLNWTARHAISPEAMTRIPASPFEVTGVDFIALAAKLVYAIGGYNAGFIPDVTATYDLRSLNQEIATDVVLHFHEGGERRYALSLPF
jgi:hypothetical protein